MWLNRHRVKNIHVSLHAKGANIASGQVAPDRDYVDALVDDEIEIPIVGHELMSRYQEMRNRNGI
jgi:hypothetical protein